MRVRLRFTKLGKIRFTSHRDVARAWERALRRAGVPVARSRGYSPRPRLHFGLALPTGYESLAEYLDVDLAEGAALDPAMLPVRLTAALPGGVAVTAAAAVAPGTPSLQESVVCCRWEIEVDGLDLTALASRSEALRASPELVMTRQRKGAEVTEDVRPHLHSIEAIEAPDADGLLVAELGSRNRGLRPSELVTLLGEEAREGRTRRTHQFTEQDGIRSEPLMPGDERARPTAALALAPTGPPRPAPHAEERAS